MAYETSVMTACVNFLAGGLGLRGSAYSKALLDTHTLFQSTNYKDAGKIATFGFPALQRLFATQGLCCAEAAQGYLALLSVAGQSAQDGTTFIDRSAFLVSVCRLLGSFYLQGNATKLQSVGLSMTSVYAAPPVDRLATLVYVLYTFRKVNPGSFSTTFNYAALRVLTDNFLNFELARIGYAVDVPSTIAPTYKAYSNLTGASAFPAFLAEGNVNTQAS